jgi:hypothetical protein
MDALKTIAGRAPGEDVAVVAVAGEDDVDGAGPDGTGALVVGVSFLHATASASNVIVARFLMSPPSGMRKPPASGI